MRVEDVPIVRHTEQPPDAFSWVGYLPTQPRDQGSCGSCYALVATQVAEDRMALHGRPVPHLDYMAVTDGSCIYYKGKEGCLEGCSGGFVLGALEHLRRTGAPALGDPDGKHYRTLGQYSLSQAAHPDMFGVVAAREDMPGLSRATLQRTADSIAQDVLLHGPVCATFNMFSDFVDYVMENPDEPYYIGWQTGIEASPPEGKVHWSDKNAVRFETAHSVSIVGFGVSAKGVPFWIVRNSWGGPGYVKVVRGRNVSGIESSVEAPRVYGNELASAEAVPPRGKKKATNADNVAISVSVVVIVLLIILLCGVHHVRQ